MITGEKKLLRAWALFLPGGIRLQGAHEYTPPAINITTVDNGCRLPRHAVVW